MRRRTITVSAAGFLSIALVGACDLSPTALDELDPAQVNSLLGAAAARNSDPGRRALYDLAGAAAGAPVGNLPQLDSLFDLALGAQASADPERSDRDRRTRQRMLSDAWSEIARGETGQGERSLVSVRRFQAETVVRVLGAPTALLYNSLLERSVRESRRTLEEGPADDETARLSQMVSTIRELQTDARRAWADGDAAGSIDIASHAAGLANALARRLAER